MIFVVWQCTLNWLTTAHINKFRTTFLSPTNFIRWHTHAPQIVSSINRSAYPQLKNLRAIKPFLDMEAANTAAHAFVSYRLDPGNSILYGIAQYQLQRIQRTQNTAASIITNTMRYENTTPVLRQLHWLPIQKQIEFKVLCLTYKAFHNMAPLYLTQFLSQKKMYQGN